MDPLVGAPYLLWPAILPPVGQLRDTSVVCRFRQRNWNEDLNIGSSKLTSGINGPVVAKDGSNATVFTGSGVLDANSPKSIAPKLIDARIFVGFQLNDWAAHLFAQATVASPSTLAILAGLRASW